MQVSGILLELAGLFRSSEFDCLSTVSASLLHTGLDIVLGRDADDKPYTLQNVETLQISTVVNTFRSFIFLRGRKFCFAPLSSSTATWRHGLDLTSPDLRLGVAAQPMFNTNQSAIIF